MSILKYFWNSLTKPNADFETRYSRRNLLLYLFIYKTVIEVVYICSISPAFAYYGLRLDIDLLKFALSTVMVFLLHLISPKSKENPSTFLFLIIEIMIIIPTLSYFWLNNKSVVYALYLFISSCIIAVILKFRRKKIILDAVLSHHLLNVLFVGYLLMAVWLIVERGGIDPRAFSFQSIYELRAEYKMSRISGYLMNWSVKVFAPFFFVYHFYHRNKIRLAVVMVLQALMYLSFGNKAFLLSIVLLIFVQFVMIHSRNSSGMFVGLLTAANAAALVTDILGLTTLLRNLMPYRMLFVPSMGQFRYFEFFNVNNKLMFSEGILGRFIGTPYEYDKPIGFIVNQYFRGEDFISNGNTGVFSYAYADYGFPGMIAMAVILGGVFWFIDSTTYRLPVFVATGALCYSTVILNDTGLLVSLWTGGIVLMVLMLMLFNSEQKYALRVPAVRFRWTKTAVSRIPAMPPIPEETD